MQRRVEVGDVKKGRGGTAIVLVEGETRSENLNRGREEGSGSGSKDRDRWLLVGEQGRELRRGDTVGVKGLLWDVEIERDKGHVINSEEMATDALGSRKTEQWHVGVDWGPVG